MLLFTVACLAKNFVLLEMVLQFVGFFAVCQIQLMMTICMFLRWLESSPLYWDSCLSSSSPTCITCGQPAHLRSATLTSQVNPCHHRSAHVRSTHVTG